MKDYKAFTVEHMFIQAYELFGLSAQDIVFPQPGDQERWDDFFHWCISGILSKCTHPAGEFQLLYGNMIAKVMLGQVLACDISLDPVAYWMPEAIGREAGTVWGFLEPVQCPKCNTVMDPHFSDRLNALLCAGCGYTTIRGSENNYVEVVDI